MIVEPVEVGWIGARLAVARAIHAKQNPRPNIRDFRRNQAGQSSTQRLPPPLNFGVGERIAFRVRFDLQPQGTFANLRPKSHLYKKHAHTEK